MTKIKENIKSKPVIKVVNLSIPDEPIEKKPKIDTKITDWQKFGSDNLFINHLARISRKSPTHAGIIKNKVRYTNQGFVDNELKKYLKSVNADGKSMQHLLRNIIFDFVSTGNTGFHIVTNARRSIVNLYHKDITTFRLSYDGKFALFHKKWSDVTRTKNQVRVIPVFPEFDKVTGLDGKEIEGEENLHSFFYIKEYVQEFDFYGLPDWFSGLDAAGIMYKTNRWNLSRLDNNFNSSGILLVDGDMSVDDAEDLKKEIEKNLTGEDNQGKIILIIKQLGGDGTKFTSINEKVEGDWVKLHEQSQSDLITAHNWFRSLTGLTDNSGFDVKRMLHEYEVAQNTVIQDYHDLFKESIIEIYDHFKIDMNELEWISKPPVSIMSTIEPSLYVKKFEARQHANLEFDENDEDQQTYCLTKKTK